MVVIFEVFFLTSSFSYENNVFSELKTSGELKNISNDSIRNNLMGLEALVTIIKNQEKSVSGQLEISSNFINRYGSHRKIFDDNGFNDTFNFPKAKKYTSNLALLKQKEFGSYRSSEIAPFIAMYWGSLMIGRWTGAVAAFNFKQSTKSILKIIAPFVALYKYLSIKY